VASVSFFEKILISDNYPSFTVNPIKLRQTRAHFILGASIEITSSELPHDPKILRGLHSKLHEMAPVAVPQGLDHEGPYSEVIVPNFFPPGSVLVFQTQLQEHDPGLDAFCTAGASEAFEALDLVDANVVLYRAGGEERDATADRFSAYMVPGLGTLTYCGLEGWMHPLKHIMRNNDLGHPLCAHLREGTWAFDYVHERLIQYVLSLHFRNKSFIDYFQKPACVIPEIGNACKMAEGTLRSHCEKRPQFPAPKVFCFGYFCSL
jgi:hypothetical protein